MTSYYKSILNLTDKYVSGITVADLPEISGLTVDDYRKQLNTYLLNGGRRGANAEDHDAYSAVAKSSYSDELKELAPYVESADRWQDSTADDLEAVKNILSKL